MGNVSMTGAALPLVLTNSYGARVITFEALFDAFVNA